MASFANVYYKRAVATAKPCYVCYRPTNTVLATLNTTDFVYTCDMHLSDSGFASRVDAPETETKPAAAPAPAVSTEEIMKVKREWEEHQRKKDEKAKADKDKDKKDDKDKDAKDAKKDASKPSTPSTPSTPATPATPATTGKHEKYTLHRHVFTMRQDEHRRRRNAAQVKAVAPRIPSAPRSTFD